MKVSFIVPLYNCLEFTQAMVASLRASLPSSLDHEIILVDDGSTDGTRPWLGSLAAPFRVVLNERNLGYAGANNRGAAVATGDILVLLNNDLVLPQGWLGPMLEVHRKLGTPAGVVGNLQRDARTGALDHTGILVNAKAKPEHDRRPPPFWQLNAGAMRIVPAVTGACALVSRSVWVQLGGFDEGFSNGGEDVDLCFRARATGLHNAVALASTVLHHISASPGRKLRDEQNSRRLALRWRNELEQLALRSWCWDYLRLEWTSPRDPTDYRKGWTVLFHLLHLQSGVPEIALHGVRSAMDHELRRWNELLG
jgi:GT2 family glycosyltransferase